jgi:purine-binding chemotaxis protein CheW
VGRNLLALALSDVAEVMRPLRVSSVEGAPPFVLGVGVVRGTPVPVIDARLLLGEPSSPGPAGRWISLRLGSRRAALAVDDVLGTRTLDDATLETMPPLLRSAAPGAAEAVAALDDELILVMRAGRLVPEAAWDAVEGSQRR